MGLVDQLKQVGGAKWSDLFTVDKNAAGPEAGKAGAAIWQPGRLHRSRHVLVLKFLQLSSGAQWLLKHRHFYPSLGTSPLPGSRVLLSNDHQPSQS